MWSMEQTGRHRSILGCCYQHSSWLSHKSFFTETGTDCLMEVGRVSKRGCLVSLDFCCLPVSFSDKWKNLDLLNFVDDGNGVCE